MGKDRDRDRDRGDDDRKRRRTSDSDTDTSSDDSSSSDSEREERRKDRKSKKDNKHKKSRKHSSKSKDGKKEKSKSKDKGKDPELVRQARAFLEQQLAAGGAGTGAGGGGAGRGVAPACGLGGDVGSGPLPPVQVAEVKEKITEDDYFRRHAEFSCFLSEERRTPFGELSSERAHELFTEFVTIWNEGRLAPKYYAGLVAAPLRRTEYRWKLGAAAGGSAGPGAGSGAGAAGRGSSGMAAFLEDQKTKQVGARQDERRHDRARAREFLEDIAPRDTGRDKMVAERAARRELARSARDDDGGLGGFIPGGGRGGEDDLLGGGDSFEAAKAREARRLETQRNRTLARADDVAQRAAAYAAKEEDKLAGLRALLAKGPITIAKRQQ